jgi:hypothetical protein
MQLDYAILADAAISKGDGLMHLIGGGISNFNVPAIPAPISASLAINFWANRADLQREHRLEIRYIDEDGNPMPEIKTLDLPIPPDPNVIQPKGTHINLMLTISLNQIQVTRAGHFSIDVIMDGRSVKQIPFNINLVIPAAPR